MSAEHKTIFELAEAYLSHSLTEAELAGLNSRLADDALFASEFYESRDLISSLENEAKQKRFRSMLQDIHHNVAAAPKKSTIIKLPAHWWRTAAVAAGVAILTSTITYSILTPSIKSSLSQYNTIRRDVMASRKVQAQQQAQLNQLMQKVNKNLAAPPAADARYTGTGFALTNDGYFVTAYHVINDGNGDFDSVYIQNHDGQYYKAFLVNFNAKTDVAILKVEKKNFRFSKSDLPYTLADDKAALGADIFTLGYPKDDIVYSKGYISASNGYNSDDAQYTLQLPAGHGQSGSPVIADNGKIIGLLTAVGSQADGNTYAIGSAAVLDLLHTIPNGNVPHLSKSNKLARMSREEQIGRMEEYTVSVKVYKK